MIENVLWGDFAGKKKGFVYIFVIGEDARIHYHSGQLVQIPFASCEANAIASKIYSDIASYS